uniref:RING-type domain-containing protein n=1 Tax=Florenciella sp. virus SA2 TaxID=3240092 RepID=A0AB39JAN1_9VIRU
MTDLSTMNRNIIVYNEYYITNKIQSYKMNNEGSFIHFDNPKLMRQFKRSNRDKYHYGHECCEGKGLLVLNINAEEAIKIEIEYYNINKQNKNKNPITEPFECSVCFETTTTSADINCDHLFCKSCIDQIKNKANLNNSCPLCRKPF